MSASPELRAQLEKYELLAEIGHGGMATVYRARDKRLGREVAVKIIHHHLRENSEVAKRFESEARAVAKVKHPNIVEVYDVSDADEAERYIVVELVRGTTLRKLLAEAGPLPPEVAASIGIDLAEALDHAHRLGVIHRDVKPENVLIGPGVAGDNESVQVKITDFGIAKLLDAQGVTSTGQVLGSPAHMAPEQIEGGDVDGRADVFGLGVLLYECMVGRLPFDGKNPAQVLRRVLDGSFTAPDRARPTIGDAYSRILSCALAHAANERYESAKALSQALKDELALLGIDDPRQELRDFSNDPKLYAQAHEKRVVDRLVERARKARERRDVPLAAACYNRALAYRPNDAELIASVSRLLRQRQLRKTLQRVLVVLVLGLMFFGLVLGVSRVFDTGPEPTAVVVAPPRPSAAPARVQAPTPASAEPREVTSAEPVRRPVRVFNVRANSEPAGPDAGGIARVKILVDGPQNAAVRIDGTEVQWFGKMQELSVGEHVFEFLPPDETCCEPAHKKTVLVPAPAGPEDVYSVKGRIEFRPAILDLQGPAGGTASCGTLGEFPVPSSQRIPMTEGSLSGRCQLLPPPGSSEPPKAFDVTLRPGQLSTNPR